ncbi:MAG: hypothetical protein GF370_00900 [Candidatus Nealsonbacteria bacterium]|nr:hypothetical protein [Candidatus Nealsonbacteria bacterium]
MATEKESRSSSFDEEPSKDMTGKNIYETDIAKEIRQHMETMKELRKQHQEAEGKKAEEIFKKIRAENERHKEEMSRLKGE